MIQTVRGKLVDGDSVPLANVIVEMQFSYGESQLTGPGVPVLTDDSGNFSVDVRNNAEGVDKVALTVNDEIVHTFDFDPEASSVDLDPVTIVSLASGRPRLIAAIPQSVPKDPKTAATVIGSNNTTYLLQSDFDVTGLDPGYSFAEGRYTYRGELNGKGFFLITTETGTADPATSTGFKYDSGDGRIKFYAGATLIWSSGDSVDNPWEAVNWDQEGSLAGPPICTERPEVKEITIGELATAIDAILNP